jgi:hypothetical protein
MYAHHQKTSLNLLRTPDKTGTNAATTGNPVIATVPVFRYPGKIRDLLSIMGMKNRIRNQQ